MLKKVGIGILVALLLTTIFLFVETQSRLREAQAEAAVLALKRDAALAEAAKTQLRIDSLTREFRKQETERAREKAVAERRAADLTARADALEEEVSAMLPQDAVGQQVREAVAEIRAINETRIRDLSRLLASTEESLRQATESILAKDRLNEELRTALSMERRRANLWEEAAKPMGFFENLKSQSGLLSGALTLGVGIGIVLTR